MFWEVVSVSVTIFLIVIIIGALGVVLVKSIDYIEDHPHAAKEKIQYVIYCIIAGHLLFLVCGFSWIHIMFSLSIEYVFHILLDTHPYIKPTDLRLIYAIVASIINHFLVIRNFVLKGTNPILVVLSFFMIWCVPFSFFLSISILDDAPWVQNNPNRKKVSKKTYIGIFIDYVTAKLLKSEDEENIIRKFN